MLLLFSIDFYNIMSTEVCDSFLSFYINIIFLNVSYRFGISSEILFPMDSKKGRKFEYFTR